MRAHVPRQRRHTASILSGESSSLVALVIIQTESTCVIVSLGQTAVSFSSFPACLSISMTTDDELEKGGAPELWNHCEMIGHIRMLKAATNSNK